MAWIFSWVDIHTTNVVIFLGIKYCISKSLISFKFVFMHYQIIFIKLITHIFFRPFVIFCKNLT